MTNKHEMIKSNSSQYNYGCSSCIYFGKNDKKTLLKQYSNIYFLSQKLQNDKKNQQINMTFGTHANEIIKQFGCKAHVNWPT
jgi:hypothetical protein